MHGEGQLLFHLTFGRGGGADHSSLSFEQVRASLLFRGGVSHFSERETPLSLVDHPPFLIHGERRRFSHLLLGRGGGSLPPLYEEVETSLLLRGGVDQPPPSSCMGRGGTSFITL